MSRFLRTFCLSLLLAIGCAVYASETDKSEAKDRLHIGVRAQYAHFTPTTVKHVVSGGPGYGVGVIGYVPIGKMIYFNGGLFFGKEKFDLDGIGGAESYPIYFIGHLNVTGFRVPLDFGLKVIQTRSVRFSVYTGPHFSFNTSVRATYNMENPTSHEVYASYESKSLDNFMGMESSWGFGLGLDFKYHWHLQVEGTIGLTRFAKMERVYKNKEANIKRNSLSVGIGYNF